MYGGITLRPDPPPGSSVGDRGAGHQRHNLRAIDRHKASHCPSAIEAYLLSFHPTLTIMVVAAERHEVTYIVVCSSLFAGNDMVSDLRNRYYTYRFTHLTQGMALSYSATSLAPGLAVVEPLIASWLTGAIRQIPTSSAFG